MQVSNTLLGTLYCKLSLFTWDHQKVVKAQSNDDVCHKLDKMSLNHQTFLLKLTRKLTIIF